MDGLLTAPKVGETYGGGTVTRRQVSPQGKIRLLVNGEWIIFEPSPPLDGFKPGDIIQLVNPNCWEAELWEVGTQATVKLIWEQGTRLVIETERSRKDNFCYTVDAENWRIVELPPNNAHAPGSGTAPTGHHFKTPGNFHPGDWVKYRGNNRTLRMQCDYSRREGLQIVSLDGDIAVIKSPKWACTYQVSQSDLVLEHRGQNIHSKCHSPSPEYSTDSGTDGTDGTDVRSQITLDDLLDDLESPAPPVNCGQKFKPGLMVRYTGHDPELQRQLPAPAPVTSVQPWDKTLWVQRPSGGDVTFPMADVEVITG